MGTANQHHNIDILHTPRSTLLEIDTHKEWKGMHYINKKIKKKAYNSQNIISSNISPNMHIYSFVCNNQNFLNSIGSKFPEKNGITDRISWTQW